MRKRLTKPLWLLHSWLGLLCGLGLIVIGVTGSLLVFHDEIDAWRQPGLYHARPTAAGRLPYDALWTSLRRALPDEKITGWVPAYDPRRTDAIYLTRTGEEEPHGFHLNPYTGEVLGSPVAVDRTLFGWLLDLHYSFLGGTTGAFVAGLLAVGLLVLGLGGVYLYRGFWRNFFTLRWGRSARIFFSDLHKMVGISSVAFNLILGFTGAWWNLNLVWGQWTAKAPPAAQTPPPAPAAPFEFAAAGVTLKSLLARADHELPGFRLIYLALPTTQDGAITLYGTVPTPNPLRGDYGSRVLFAGKDGALTQVVDIRKASAWEKIGDSFALLHYGTFGAAFGPAAEAAVKIVWMVLGLAPGVLAVSGFLIWRARRRGRVTRNVALPSIPGPLVPGGHPRESSTLGGQTAAP